MVKITAEVRNFIVSLDGTLSHAGGKISISQLPRCLTKLSDRCGYLARQPEADKPRDQQDSRDAKKLGCWFGLQKYIGDWVMRKSLEDYDVMFSTRPCGALAQ
jgi:hypothetical protein